MTARSASTTTAGRGRIGRTEPRDSSLLARFHASRDDLAFARLVERHGPMVMGVCRRMLMNEQEAEDAFQATFLILAKKSHSLRCSDSLPAWLHRTAFRVSLRCRADRQRRREQSLPCDVMSDQHPAFAQIAADHQRSVLDEELNRLPGKFRKPIFLCCVEGKSREEAARQLGWSVGSLKGRLERGRALLRRRLSLRGVACPLTMIAFLSSQSPAQAAIAPSLVASTVQAGTQFNAGQPVLGYVSLKAFQLATGSLHVMPIVIIKPLFACVVAVGVLLGVGSVPVDSLENSSRANPIVLTTSAGSPGEARLVAEFGDDDQRDTQRERAERSDRDADEERDARIVRDEEAVEIEGRTAPATRERRVRRDGDREIEREEEVVEVVRERGEDREREEIEFRPQTDREAILFRMIMQLRREVSELKQTRATDRPRLIERDGDRERIQLPSTRRTSEGREDTEITLSDGWQRTRAGKVFQAYDRNQDGAVSLEEWFAMKEGLGPEDSERRELEARRFREADPRPDGKMTAAEFIYWYTKGRFQATRERDQRGERSGSVRRERDQGRERDGDRARSREVRRDGDEARAEESSVRRREVEREVSAESDRRDRER